MKAARGSILVGVDFSEASRTALHQAARMARQTGSPLHVLHAIDPDVLAEIGAWVRTGNDAVRREAITQVRSHLIRWIRAARIKPRPGISIQAGKPADVLLAMAKRGRTRLLAVGRSGETVAGLGSVALRCVRESRVPVLLVPSSLCTPYRRIVACADLQPQNRRVLRLASEAARRDRARLSLLHVYRAPWHRYHYRAPTPEAAPEFRREYLELLTQRLRASCPDPGLPRPMRFRLAEHVSHGQGILDFATAWKADLVVIGTRRRRLAYGILGSTAERVVAGLPCAVLAVPPEAAR